MISNSWPVYLALAAVGTVLQPPAEVHSVELTEWRADAGGNGHFYEAVASPKGITWTDAETYAEAHGGYLATIGSEKENQFVFNLVNDAQFWANAADGHAQGPWLGGVKNSHAIGPKDGWEWTHNEGPFTYTNWQNGQLGGEKGARVANRLNFYGESTSHRQPRWSAEADDTLLHGFVVEYDQNPLPASLQYVALFGVCVVGAIALGGIGHFLYQGWRKKKHPTAVID